MARLRDLVIDCRVAAPLARFWAATLDGYRVAPYDEAELTRLRALGVHDPEDDPSVLVEPVDGVGPRWFFTRVPEGRAQKNRMHPDLVADDLVAEADRLVSLGATVIDRCDGWLVLADPEGNEFCLFPG